MPRSRTASLILIVSVLVISASIISILHKESNNNARIETGNSSLQAYFTASIDKNTVAFSDQSRGVNVISWEWEFGDGTFSEDQSPAHTYSYTGNYSVILTITDSNGQSSQWVKVVEIEILRNDTVPLALVLPVAVMVIGGMGIVFSREPVGRIIMAFVFLGGLVWLMFGGAVGTLSLILAVIL